MTRLTILLALVFATVSVSSSDAQLFPRLRRAQKETQRTERQNERQNERQKKKLADAEKARLKAEQKLARKSADDAPRTAPVDQTAFQSVRPRAASGLEVEAAKRAASGASDPVFFLDRNGQAQRAVGKLNPAQQYYKRQQGFVGRDGRAYLVLKALTRQEFAKITNSQNSQSPTIAAQINPNTQPRRAPSIATTSFNQPVLNAPKLNPPTSSAQQPTVTTTEAMEELPDLEPPKSVSTTKAQNTNSGVLKSVLERVDENPKKDR